MWFCLLSLKVESNQIKSVMCVKKQVHNRGRWSGNSQPNWTYYQREIQIRRGFLTVPVDRVNVWQRPNLSVGWTFYNLGSRVFLGMGGIPRKWRSGWGPDQLFLRHSNPVGQAYAETEVGKDCTGLLKCGLSSWWEILY